MNDPAHHSGGWADNPVVRRRIRIALYVLCALLLIVELFVSRTGHNRIESIPLMYAVYGFGSLVFAVVVARGDRKSTRLNSSHVATSYAVFCLKKKKQNRNTHTATTAPHQSG